MCQFVKSGIKQNFILIFPLTYERVVLEEDVVAFSAADLEDEFTDVEQVVSTHTQLEEEEEEKQSFVFVFTSALNALNSTPRHPLPLPPSEPLVYTNADTQMTHLQAELGNVQVELR